MSHHASVKLDDTQLVSCPFCNFLEGRDSATKLWSVLLLGAVAKYSWDNLRGFVGVPWAARELAGF